MHVKARTSRTSSVINLADPTTLSFVAPDAECPITHRSDRKLYTASPRAALGSLTTGCRSFLRGGSCSGSLGRSSRTPLRRGASISGSRAGRDNLSVTVSRHNKARQIEEFTHQFSREGSSSLPKSNAGSVASYDPDLGRGTAAKTSLRANDRCADRARVSLFNKYPNAYEQVSGQQWFIVHKREKGVAYEDSETRVTSGEDAEYEDSIRSLPP
jgi:hypothetical protein